MGLLMVYEFQAASLTMVFIIATKFDMHDSLNVFSIYISGPKVLIELWQHETASCDSRCGVDINILNIYNIIRQIE